MATFVVFRRLQCVVPWVFRQVRAAIIGMEYGGIGREARISILQCRGVPKCRYEDDQELRTCNTGRGIQF